MGSVGRDSQDAGNDERADEGQRQGLFLDGDGVLLGRDGGLQHRINHAAVLGDVVESSHADGEVLLTGVCVPHLDRCDSRVCMQHDVF